jgi:hypothetical protein
VPTRGQRLRFDRTTPFACREKANLQSNSRDDGISSAYSRDKAGTKAVRSRDEAEQAGTHPLIKFFAHRNAEPSAIHAFPALNYHKAPPFTDFPPVTVCYTLLHPKFYSAFSALLEQRLERLYNDDPHAIAGCHRN